MSEIRATDESLMMLVQQGGREPFAALAARYEKQLMRFARSRTGRRDWAEEIVQETLLAAYRGRNSFRAEHSFRSWLWSICWNESRRHYRRRREEIFANQIEQTANMSASLDQLVGREPSPGAALETQEQHSELESLLNQLSGPRADALRLRFFAELKFREIAETMGCSLLTAKNRVREGLIQIARVVSATEARRIAKGPIDD